MQLYIDGNAPDTNPYTGGLGTTSGGIGNFEPIALGANTNNSDDLIVTPTVQHLDGSMDDVRIFNRALNLAEIQALANCTSAISGTIYEDINYGGGDGRDYTSADTSVQASGWAAGAIGAGAVEVELYENQAGNLPHPCGQQHSGVQPRVQCHRVYTLCSPDFPQ
jgi:hypothetical protein